MPLQTLLPLSLFRPFKNIRSILGEGGRKFPSPRPARPHCHRKREKKKKREKKQPPKHPKATKPDKGKALGRRSWQTGESRGEPDRGGREGRRAGGWEEVPGRSESPGGVPRRWKTSTTQLFPQSGRLPRLPLAPGRPAGPLAGGAELEPRLHSPGCRRWAKRLGFTLPKTPEGGAAPFPPDLPGCSLASLPVGFLPAVPSGRVFSLPPRLRCAPALPSARPGRRRWARRGPSQAHCRWAKPQAALPPPG